MNKTKLLIWAIFLLLILNITTISTIMYHNYMEKIENQTVILDSENGSRLNGRFFRQNIGFNLQQMKVFRDANQEFQPKANYIIWQIDSLKNEIFLELKKQNSNTNKLDSLSEKIGTQHAELKKETNTFFLNIKKVCTPQQINQLQTVFKPFFNNENCQGNRMKNCRKNENRN